MDYEKIEEEKQRVRIKEYTDLMGLAHSVMDADDKIRASIRAKSTAEEKYQKAKKEYNEKYPEV